MTDPLFPLPGDAAPPEARPAGPRRRRGRPRGPQPSLFSAVLADPAPGDLAGLLAGTGQVVRMGGTARVSVVVAEEWRAAELLAAFDERGLSGGRVPTVDDHIGVRTAFCAALAPLATAWLRGTVTRPPAGFRADGLALRLWALSGGRQDSTGYLLPLPGRPGGGGTVEVGWQALAAALRGAGFAPEVLTGVPALRVTGRTRLSALADLLGPPPPRAPTSAWP